MSDNKKNKSALLDKAKANSGETNSYGEKLVDRSKKKDSRLRDTLRIMVHKPTCLIGMIIIVAMILCIFLVPAISPYGYEQIDPSNAYESPSAAHPFGTDNLGRDQMVRVFYGGRYTLSIGIFATAIALIIGIIIGAVAGFFGGTVDNLIMRFLDIMQAFPQLLMAITLSAIFGTGFDKTIIAIGITSIPGFARMLRANILTVRRQEYIDAATTINCSTPRIIAHHALPNAMSPLIVQTAMQVAQAGSTASALSFIGLGIQPPTPEWGALLAAARNQVRYYPYLALFPGLAIMITMLSFNLIGDGLRDALDPKLRR